MHQSNIFVDSNWNIKRLVDLEWACSLPAETLRVPYWLTGRSVDNLTGVHFEEFSRTYDRFIEIFEEEEQEFPPIDNIPPYRTGVMKRSWKLGSFWYFSALDTTKGLYNLFHDHIQPIFTTSCGTDIGFSQILSEYWAADTREVIAEKLRDNQAYEKELRELFEKGTETA